MIGGPSSDAIVEEMEVPAAVFKVSVVVPPPELIFAVRWLFPLATGGVVGVHPGNVWPFSNTKP